MTDIKISHNTKSKVFNSTAKIPYTLTSSLMYKPKTNCYMKVGLSHPICKSNLSFREAYTSDNVLDIESGSDDNRSKPYSLVELSDDKRWTLPLFFMAGIFIMFYLIHLK